MMQEERTEPARKAAKARWAKKQRKKDFRSAPVAPVQGAAKMIGAGPFEVLAGLVVAALLLYYYVLRDRRPVALVLLVVVLTPVLGFFVAIGVALLRYALLGR